MTALYESCRKEMKIEWVGPEEIHTTISRLRGQGVESAMIVVDIILVQNLLAPFCCVLGKKLKVTFLLFQISAISL